MTDLCHRYGPNVHILSDVFLLSHLSRLCSPETTQPAITELITTIYSSLLRIVINAEFPVRNTEVPTRMAAFHPEGVYQGPVVDPETRVVSVNLARAGTVPSHVCYSALNYLMNPRHIRQDHISIGRTTDDASHVTGSRVFGHKMAPVEPGTIVLFPDPMGATGHTICEVMDLYGKQPLASPNARTGARPKFIALHCIVTPEYLKRVKERHPELVVYAVRLDRGLSPQAVLDSEPGMYWDQEKGLNDHQYIVPGGGGFGEIMNNAEN